MLLLQFFDCRQTVVISMKVKSSRKKNLKKMCESIQLAMDYLNTV